MTTAEAQRRLAPAWAALASDPGISRAAAQAVLIGAPEHPEATALLAAASRRLGDLAGSVALLQPLMRRRPCLEAAWFEWGMTLAAIGEEAQAVEALREATRLQPGFANAWRALGDQLMLLGAGMPAGEAYAQAAWRSLRDPALAPAAAALGAGQAGTAAAALRAHLRGWPDDLHARYLLAEAVLREGGTDEAERLLESCLETQKRFFQARHCLAILLYAMRRFDRAATHFRELHEAAPHQPCLRRLLLVCLVEVGDFAAAIPLYEAILAAYHDQPASWLRYGHALKTLGRAEEAVRAYRVCIELGPAWVAGAYLSLADVKTARFADAEVDAMLDRTRRAGTSLMEASQLHYALGQALDQRGSYENAFAHFLLGARARRQMVEYDAAETTAFVDRNCAVFTAETFAPRRAATGNDAVPIFIVGLPRAGSTLVEQILASHPEVEGTAELREIGMIAAELRGTRPPAALPDIVVRLDAATRARLGSRYLDATRQFRRAGRRFFTDKMPDNFLHAGLIRAILPTAVILDVRRDPMAAGFAAFRQFFQPHQKGQDYTYDLEEIGRYYRDYCALMAHFVRLQPGCLRLVQYERLVTDTEREVRALLDHCSLPFDATCLRFWETKRAVQTPSSQQVRQPIFQDSLEVWRNYERWLAPLREALRI